jgi:hypothetical protein
MLINDLKEKKSDHNYKNSTWSPLTLRLYAIEHILLTIQTITYQINNTSE